MHIRFYMSISRHPHTINKMFARTGIRARAMVGTPTRSGAYHWTNDKGQVL